MTSITLAQSYLVKATKRLKILPVLLKEQAYSDVVDRPLHRQGALPGLGIPGRISKLLGFLHRFLLRRKGKP